METTEANNTDSFSRYFNRKCNCKSPYAVTGGILFVLNDIHQLTNVLVFVELLMLRQIIISYH